MTPRAPLVRAERRDRDVGAAQLEGADRLQGLGLQELSPGRVAERDERRPRSDAPEHERGRANAVEADERLPAFTGAASQCVAGRLAGSPRTGAARDAGRRPRQEIVALQRGSSAVARLAGGVRPGREASEGVVHGVVPALGLLAEGQVALLGEDVRGRGRLRPIGHLPRRLDLLPELLPEGRTDLLEAGAGAGGRIERGGHALHPTLARRDAQPAAYTPREYRIAPGGNRGGGNMAIAIDPVCGMEVVMETATLTSEHDGTTYYFCGKGCKLDFDEDPETYLDPGYDPRGHVGGTAGCNGVRAVRRRRARRLTRPDLGQGCPVARPGWTRPISPR